MGRKFAICIGLIASAQLAIACGASPPTDKQALQMCQSIARGKMKDVAGNPRYRQAKTRISEDQSGPENFKYTVYGEYFYKTVYSGDTELSFTCSISKHIDADDWTTDAFDSVCVGGCS
jgi:hypothetical protein